MGDLHKERPDLAVIGRLRRWRSLSAEQLVYRRARTRATPKVNLPSPGLLSNFWSPERSTDAYGSLDEDDDSGDSALQFRC